MDESYQKADLILFYPIKREYIWFWDTKRMLLKLPIMKPQRKLKSIFKMWDYVIYISL